MSDLRLPPVGLASAIPVGSWSELDAMCEHAGVVGDTYPTGATGYAARRACAVIGGVLHDAPALYNATTGAWPWPGHRPASFTHSRTRRADEAAERLHNRPTP